ncbi:Zinc finger, PHD-finger, partial [Dillenia turbinata]
NIDYARNVGSFQYLMQRHQQQHGNEIQQKKMLDIVKRIEEGLFKDAYQKEDFMKSYMNLDTLEVRLHEFIKQLSSSNQNQQYPPLVNSSSSIGTMIPTPGMTHGGNSNLMGSSSLDTSMIPSSMAPTAVSSGSMLPTANGPSVSIHSGSFNSDGSLSNGYQQSASNFSIHSGGNNMMPSIGVQRITSQMIPTPGLNTSGNQSYMNLDSSNNGGGFSTVDSTMVSQSQQPKQPVGAQNSRILHNLGSQMGSGIRSNFQQRTYGFANGSINGGLAMSGSNSQVVSGPGTSEGYLTATPYGSSHKPLQQHFDQQHSQQLIQGNLCVYMCACLSVWIILRYRILISNDTDLVSVVVSISDKLIDLTGDGYGISSSDLSGSGNVYGPITSAGSIVSKANPNLSNLHTTQQAAPMKPHAIDQPENMSFHPSHSMRENVLQSQQPQPFQQQAYQFQQPQFLQHQRHQKHQTQHHQLTLKNDSFGQSQLAPDLVNQVKTEKGMESHNDVLHTPVSEHFQLPEMQNQFQQNLTSDRQRGAQLFSFPSGPQDISSSFSQNSQQMQQLLHSQQMIESQNDLSCLSIGSQSLPVKGQWQPQAQDRSHIQGNLSVEQHIQEEFHQRITGQDEAQCTLSSEGSIPGQTTASRGNLEHLNASYAAYRSPNLNREKQYKNQQRWLLFLYHARRCRAPEGKCQDVNCITVQRLWHHMVRCNVPKCAYPRCHASKKLLGHHKVCRDPGCPVCVPVNNFLQGHLKARLHLQSELSQSNSVNHVCSKSFDTGDAATRLKSKTTPSPIGISEDLQSSVKRLKTEQPSQSVKLGCENSTISLPVVGDPHVSGDVQPQVYQQNDVPMPMKPEFVEVKMEAPIGSAQGSPSISEIKDKNMDEAFNQRSDNEPTILNDSADFPNKEGLKSEKETDQIKQENVEQPAESTATSKSGKPKIKGVSLTELFTPEQVREHIMGLRQWVGQSKAKAEKNQAMEHSMSENSCQLCAVEKLTFEPPPIYCTPCGARIKRNAMYYTVGTGETRHYFCIPCYNEARGDTIIVDGSAILKARLEKKKNDEETEEWWVQCDKCEAWQHQICALFNGRRNDGGQAEYTCPNCYIEEVERGERKPLLQSAVLGAKDLPRTILSDHIEQRLFRRLKQERAERARLQGKSFDEVLGAESLVIRVVSSVDKKLEVKPRFLEIFQEENYPTEFPYKSKVVLLFQKIEGVEVCLFGMYVQEFGSECAFPNQRRVYLSYLDSVKYFRPEVKTVTGEALRTFVYHEILIGYLEYCKKRGFTSCYIWACPPLKGEDYILYCHPEIQKTPKYLSMLRKAAKEDIVADLTNLYDHFFVTTGECKAKVTAARLPYFDGDYWPGAAEDMINQLRQEEDGRKQNKKGTTKKTITKRALKASGQSDLSANASKDLLLMHKLGETICPMKEDFIMVHLQHACTHCCILMVSGIRWVCNQCKTFHKNFQLCEKCYDAEQKLEERDKHPVNHREKHVLHPVEIKDVPADTKDKDEILESEFFDTRQAFLSLCQGNHYQYDTLRRAKHSSMMVLYHLHNPTAPAFVTTCNVCHLDIEAGQGWRCETCPDYDVCNACYQKDGGVDHPHNLTNHPSMADRDAQNKEARQMRVLQLRKMLDLLVHASQCRSPNCQYPNCRKVKGLFRHGIQCKVRASGGCVLCKKMWYLLQLHARACKESECHVPRCRDLKEHLRRLQQQSDSRRRAAVMEMMRQRAAEVAGNSG